MRPDLRMAGSVTQSRGSVPADLQWPEFAILDPIVPDIRSRRPPRDPQRVLITLGGGFVPNVPTRFVPEVRLGFPRLPETRHVA